MTAVVPDISVEDNQRLAQAAIQLATGLNTVGEMVGKGDSFKKMALRMFVKFAGEQVSEQEIAAMLQDKSKEFQQD